MSKDKQIADHSVAANATPDGVLRFREEADTAPTGISAGSFRSLTLRPKEVDAHGKTKHIAILEVALSATDENGVPFGVKKLYNLEGRGLTALNDDIKYCIGLDVVDEMRGTINRPAFINHPVYVDVKYVKQGKELVPMISSFARVPEPEVATAVVQ